jgi:hypothetical protein
MQETVFFWIIFWKKLLVGGLEGTVRSALFAQFGLLSGEISVRSQKIGLLQRKNPSRRGCRLASLDF